MRNEIEAMITDITATTAEAEDYTGEDGLLYCGKCHTPKEAYFSKETAQWLGHDRHPAECDCHRAAREKREAAESRQKHLEKVEDLKRRGFTDPAMQRYSFLSVLCFSASDRNCRPARSMPERTSPLVSTEKALPILFPCTEADRSFIPEIIRTLSM